MKRWAYRSGVVCCAVLLQIAATGRAQEPTSPTPPSSHEVAARELVRLTGGNLEESGIEAMLATIRQNPELAAYEDVFRAWYRKVFASGELEAEMAKIYMELYSEQELREVAAFYRTPVGQKTLANLPILTQRGTELGMKRAQDHAAELGEMFEKAKAEREKRPDRPLTDQEAQKQTVADIRNTGTSMFSWLTDEVSAAAAGQSQSGKETKIRLPQYPPIPRAELEKLLAPQYLASVPEKDGWGHPYEYYLNVADPVAKQVMAIRSPGRDGKFSATDYGIASFTPDDYDQDIVWADGFFVRWPQAPGK